MQKKHQNLPFKRKRQGKTDYKARLRLLQAQKPRLVVRRSMKNILVQLVEFHPDGDKVIVTTSTKELQKKYGWDIARRNTPAAYLTGFLAGAKAKEKKLNEAIVDIGLQKARKGSLLFAAVKGAIDAGLKVPHDPESFPSEERVAGKHMKFKSASFDKVKEAIKKQVK